MIKLFVGNLANEVTDGDLWAAFKAFGPVTSAAIVIDRSDGTSRGFGFVEMPSQPDGLAAIKGLDGTDLKGRDINVSRARPRTDAAGGAGIQQRGWAVVSDGRRR